MNQNYDYAIVSALQHGKGTSGQEQLQLLTQCGEIGWELIAVIPKADDIWFYFKQPTRIGGLGGKEFPMAMKVRFTDPVEAPMPLDNR